VRFDIKGRPVRSILKVILFPGEELHASPGAKVMMEGAIHRVQKKQILLLHTFRAIRPDTFLWLSPSHPGDIYPAQLNSEGLRIRIDSYVAHFGPLDISPHRESGPVHEDRWMILRGMGIVWVSAPSPIEEIRLAPGEEVLVDGDFLISVSPEAEIRIIPAGMERLTPLYLIRGPSRLILFESRHSLRRGRGPISPFFHIH